MKKFLPLLTVASLAASACAPTYALVSPGAVSVAKNSIRVTPGMAWNRSPKGLYDVAWEENWTENGPLLDSISFVGGLPDGQAITKQRRKDDKKVPLFRATMNAQDLVAMIESHYRIKAGATIFEGGTVEPATFIGKPGVRFDYSYVGADSVRRRGRTVMAISDAKLYLMTLDGTALHYFDAALGDFDAMVATASLG